ncbi:hypothetical protein DPX16_15896 [Anabarilius grahami]|uniref:Uncharacterized protein n=1 Tax=Anabarilius grahami TaxID=495550 RepID=A0A3N0YUC2_ANAGA|nr:hypothetical protein DPX16_15896 [Anabarilius grahami]
MKRTLSNNPDTVDQLIKLSLYGPLRTGSMNTQVRAVHGQTASLRSKVRTGLERERETCTMDAEATVCDSNEGWLGQERGSTGTALRGDNGQHPH